MTASDIISKYISFFEKKGHKRIPNSPLVPENDLTTLFTSSGMQPLVPYLLGEPHPAGKRLVNVQNCFRAQDIDEIGDNRHTTFFRMLGNWSLGDYFKKEQLPWLWEFLTNELKLPAERLYITVFKGDKDIPKDEESEKIWTEILSSAGLNPKERIFLYGTDKNWWSRSGEPEKMPEGEPGGPDSEVFYMFDVEHDKKFGAECDPNCQCGRFMEIGNSVFMEYRKAKNGFEKLPQRNVDFGGGLERLLAASENIQDIFKTSLFSPIIESIEKVTNKSYEDNKEKMRIIADHFIAAVFIIDSGVNPSNKEQGYVLRRLLRRGLDNLSELETSDVTPVLESIVSQYKTTDEKLVKDFEKIKGIFLEEQQNYTETQERAKAFIQKKYPSTSHSTVSSDRIGSGQVKIGDELKGVSEISAVDAFILYSTHGLSPTQIKSLGFTFDEQAFARKMEEHAKISKKGSEKKFSGGLADTSEKTIMGHTATHLLHQALRDVLGNSVHQTGSNITKERVRFDFAFKGKLSDEEIKKVQDLVNRKIKENLPVHFEIMPLAKAKNLGAIGLFDEKYQDKVKVYFIGPSTSPRQARGCSGRLITDKPYSIEFCGGPHVKFTSRLKKFKILKQDNLGVGLRRLYSEVG